MRRSTASHEQEVARVRANYDSVLTELRHKHAAAIATAEDELKKARQTIADLEAELAGLRAKKT